MNAMRSISTPIPAYPPLPNSWAPRPPSFVDLWAHRAKDAAIPEGSEQVGVGAWVS